MHVNALKAASKARSKKIASKAPVSATARTYSESNLKRLKGSLKGTFKDICLKGTHLYYYTHTYQRLKGTFTDKCLNGTNQQTNH